MNSGSDPAASHACKQWESLITLLAAGENLPEELHTQWLAHSAECPGCTVTLAQEREMLALLGEYRKEPEAALLASCRAGLDDAIDRQEEYGWLRRSVAFLFPASWLTSGPAWSAAVLVLIGFSSGLLLGPRVVHHSAAATPQVAAVVPPATTQPPDAVPVSQPPASLSSLDLHSAEVAGISVLPSGGNATPEVQLHLRAQQPLILQGTVDDDNVKAELLNILGGGDRFCPDVRLDAVDLLRTRNNDPQVRSALCHAVHHDKNAAVRLKALEALNGAEPQDIIQQTLLDALVDDQNPGVRVEAINELRDMASRGEVTSNARMISVLQDRMARDSNAYIRLQSAAAMRDLGPQGNY